MPTVRDFKDLVVWQKAMDMVETVYRDTRTFPRDELYGLVSQVRRASVSIPSNIAEGQARLTRGEFKQFLGNARGSLAEVETQVILSVRLGFLKDATALTRQSVEVGKLLNGLINS